MPELSCIYIIDKIHYLAVLNDDNLCSCLLLQRLNRLATLADDSRHQVPRHLVRIKISNYKLCSIAPFPHHHFIASAAEVTPHWTTTTTSRAST